MRQRRRSRHRAALVPPGAAEGEHPGVQAELGAQDMLRQWQGSGSPRSLGVAASRFSACPVEQRGFESPRLGRRDKALLAQIALKNKYRGVPRTAGRDGTILALVAELGRQGPSLTEEGADGKRPSTGTEPQESAPALPRHRAAPGPVLRRVGAEAVGALQEEPPCSSAGAGCAQLCAGKSPARQASTSINPASRREKSGSSDQVVTFRR